MKTITYAEISQAVRSQCRNSTYHMDLTGEAAQCVERAVNQGIDSHLEACFSPGWGDSFRWDHRMIGDKPVCKCLIAEVSPDSLPVLLRRLSEADDEESQTLAGDILQTLGINVDSYCFEIVSPADEQTEVAA